MFVLASLSVKGCSVRIDSKKKNLVEVAVGWYPVRNELQWSSELGNS